MSESDNKTSLGSSVGLLGTVIAAIISFATNNSIGWAILHAICGWFYVLYWAFFGQPLP